MKKHTLHLGVLLALVMLLVTMSVPAFAETGDVEINAINFPDANFREIVSFSDVDKSNTLSATEIAAVKTLICYNKGIKDLTGIEHFTALTSLQCDYNKLTSLDISKNTALTNLSCVNNQLTVLDVSRNADLKRLVCFSNKLTTLDVGNNTALEALHCGSNELTALDVSKNAVLKELTCANNKLASLDLRKNMELAVLDCHYNGLTELDVKSNTKLTKLRCFSNSLTALDVSKNTELTELWCSTNRLTALDVSRNTKLAKLDCSGSGNLLTTLDVSKNPELKELHCGYNRLTSLDVSNNTELAVMDCLNNRYAITAASDRTFDLSNLPGNFDVSKASNWNGGTVSGNTLTVNSGVSIVTYSYDCGNEKSAIFTLNVTVTPAPTPTPTPSNTPTPGDTVSIQVTKYAHGLDKTKSYTFDFRYYQIEDPQNLDKPVEGGVKGNFSIPVSWDDKIDRHSGILTLEDIPCNTYIAIEEINPIIPQGYRLYYMYPGIARVHTTQNENYVTFYNDYNKREDCDIVISKAVAGNSANANDEFEFEITFYLPLPKLMLMNASVEQVNVPPAIGNKNRRIYITHADGSTHEFEDEDYEAFTIGDGERKATARFKLKHGERIYILNIADRNRPITVKELGNNGYDSTTVNGKNSMEWMVDAPYTDTVEVKFINTKGAVQPPEPVTGSLTVKKMWSDGNDKHSNDKVTVQLYRNGQPYSFTLFGRVVDDGKAVLSAENRWQHTWSGLDPNYTWTVDELYLPGNWIRTIDYYGNTVTITNTVANFAPPQTGDRNNASYLGAMLVLAAITVAVITTVKKRD